MTQVANKRRHKTIPNPYNIGFIDRSLRFILGGVLVGSLFYLSPPVMLSAFGYELLSVKTLALIGAYPLLTAWLGWDPIYHLLSIRSDTSLKEDKCSDIVDQVKTATHISS